MQTELNFTQEIWKDVVGYEGIYEVSSLGKIRSVKRIIEVLNHPIHKQKPWGGKILKQKITIWNRLEIGLRMDGVQKYLLVHRLVAQAFIPNPENKPQVNHKNGIPTDNRVENLEWVTAKENMVHAVDNGLCLLRGEDSGMAKFSNEEVTSMRLEFMSMNVGYKEYALFKGINETLCQRIMKNKSYKNEWMNASYPLLGSNPIYSKDRKKIK